MKNIKCWVLTTGLIATLGMSSCSKWTTLEPANPTDLSANSRTEDYYANLRAWKKTGAPVGFGWFGGWTGVGSSMKTQLMGLPDSLGVVSLWGAGTKEFDEARKADLKAVQSIKGTKVLTGFQVNSVGAQLTPHGQTPEEYWGWVDGTSEEAQAKQTAAIIKYANALCDLVDKLGLDGFDYDFEPNYEGEGNLWFDHTWTEANAGWRSLSEEKKKIKVKNMITFISTLGKRLGPQSGTDKLLTVNGEPQKMVPEVGKYFNYFIVQAYDSWGDGDLDRRLQATIDNYKGHLDAVDVARKYIVTENFEKWAAQGGANYTDRSGNVMKSLEGMARWLPVVNGKVVQKAGIGTYHMEYEYTVSGHTETYPFLRGGMNIMNPSVK